MWYALGMTFHQEWPLEAVVEKLDAETGEWKFAGAVRDVETGEKWLAKHKPEGEHRVRAKAPV